MLVQVADVSNSVSYAFDQSDGFAKFIVVLLLVLSVYAWSIMCEKGWSLMRVRRQIGRFLRQFERERSALGMALQADEYAGPIADVYREGVREVIAVLGMSEYDAESVYRSRRLPRPLSAGEIDKVRSTMDRVVDMKSMELEERLGLLGTIVSISPYLGLLGTVWGVMLAFISMAQAGRPDITTMAPGVSGALLTTVVGLIVAIPSLVGNNSIANTVLKTCTEMENFVDAFIALLKIDDTPTYRDE
jgi:biopolymer transport protein TolQ